MCCVLLYTLASQLFFFNAPPPPGIYPLSLHDALPIWEALRPRSRGAQHVVGVGVGTGLQRQAAAADAAGEAVAQRREDRKSTRLNSSHVAISYAVFCLKKKKTKCSIKKWRRDKTIKHATLWAE